MITQFITCDFTSCPMNENKTCRSPYIEINKDALCITNEDPPVGLKTQSENYVEVKTCACFSCNNWEEDSNGKGCCGYGSSLHFRDRTDSDKPKAKCKEFDGQIDQPPAYNATGL